MSSVQNPLLGMYANMAMEFSRKLFDEMSDRDVIAWSVMISGYVKSDKAHVGLGIFREVIIIQKGSRWPNGVSWNSVLSGLVYNGKHSEAINLFKSMRKYKTGTEAVTFVNLLQV
ncbi:putative tetratricopeptide-like helical domain superfamily [Helianthus annuus]|nr:putative tetratricopeptide-like helical domain superfamily [Helianthus annuus]